MLSFNGVALELQKAAAFATNEGNWRIIDNRKPDPAQIVREVISDGMIRLEEREDGSMRLLTPAHGRVTALDLASLVSSWTRRERSRSREALKAGE